MKEISANYISIKQRDYVSIRFYSSYTLIFFVIHESLQPTRDSDCRCGFDAFRYLCNELKFCCAAAWPNLMITLFYLFFYHVCYILFMTSAFKE